MFSSIPKLPNRDYPIELFSVYMTLENKNGRLTIQLKSEPNLKRNVELYKNRHKKFVSLCNQQDKGRGLVQFWMDIALKDLTPKEEWEPANRVQMALEHLTVYCEESCYRAAEQVWKEDKYQSWEEYLFFARCFIYEQNKFKQILDKYNFDNSSLNTYITGVLIRTIKDKAAVSKFSRWRLLCKKSDKELKEALFRDGHSEPEISRFLFARKYFKQVYQINQVQNPTKRTGQKWPNPDGQDFQEAVKYYNAEKLLPSAPHEVSASTNITDEQLKAWMELCIAALQNYPKSIAPRFSIEALQSAGREVESEESQEILELDLQGSIEAEESVENQGNLVNRTEAALRQQLLSLKPEQQELVLLYYGFGLEQAQLAVRFEVTQSAISRRLNTIELRLIKTLSGLGQPTEWVTQYVAGWLEYNYQAPIYLDLIHAALVEAIKKLDPQERELLRLRYGQKLDEQEIAIQLGITKSEVNEALIKAKSKLQIALLNVINNKIKQYISIWLWVFGKNLVKSACENLNIFLIQKEDSKIIEAVLEECVKGLHQSNQGG
ncbi:MULTISPECIES: sigma factor-like helix-turn-helix DNA-binding protein [Cyanophyceae]|uniref:sigma factor-like helix-turn-helix DNA-binding protein n=1 Tax=Cyanophyceae TaxID=3028117 RepID=UPI0016883C1E|nr:sigma factor-like helix-turn-helix DNA-binding protein [Trichocoleus sp. FACHB-40]MBD2002738.1 hypothetical protein [Trichocoleus sp. FACHB-40]